MYWTGSAAVHVPLIDAIELTCESILPVSASLGIILIRNEAMPVHRHMAGCYHFVESMNGLSSA